MPTLFQFDTPTLVSFTILLLMAAMSMAFALLLRERSRAIKKLPRKISVSVFDKTFNVFDPYPEHKRIIGASVFFPLAVMFGSVVIGFFAFTKVIGSGMVLGFIVLMICLGLMMIDEALEIQKSAKILVRAIGSGKGLGEGDLKAFFLVKKTLHKLTTYYFSLTIGLIASSIALPFIMSAGALVFTQFFRVILEFAVSYGPTSIFLALLFYTLAVVAIQLAAGRMKSRILSLPSSESTNSINIQLDRVRSYIKTRRQNHAKKEETTEGKKRF